VNLRLPLCSASFSTESRSRSSLGSALPDYVAADAEHGLIIFLREQSQWAAETKRTQVTPHGKRLALHRT
jgi:hypothetical protein